MKQTILICCLLWIGITIAQNSKNVCEDPITCGQCPSSWLSTVIRHTGSMQDNDTCTVTFYWDYPWQAPDLNPLLVFICYYTDNGETCNSMTQNRCGSCNNYTITDIDINLNPFLTYSDSCDQFFNLYLYDVCLGITTEPPPPTTLNPFYCPDPSVCFGCPLDYDKPDFTFIGNIPTPGYCDLTLSWDWEYDPINADNPSFDFACLYEANGEYCGPPETLCGSCRNVTFYNIELSLHPYIDFIDTCSNIEQFLFDTNCELIPPAFVAKYPEQRIAL